MPVTKVLHVIPSVDAADGGPSVMVETMARGLSDTGIEIHIATTGGAGETGGEQPVVLEGRDVLVFQAADALL